VPKKVTAQTTWGPVTRSTVRTYTHVVASYELQPGLAETWLARDIAVAERTIATYQAKLASGDFGQYGTRADYEGYLARAEARLTRLTLANVHGHKHLIVHGWCGRLDLAQKLQAKARQQGFLAEIFPLDGEAAAPAPKAAPAPQAAPAPKAAKKTVVATACAKCGERNTSTTSPYCAICRPWMAHAFKSASAADLAFVNFNRQQLGAAPVATMCRLCGLTQPDGIHG
jgi:hypothetical protein